MLGLRSRQKSQVLHLKGHLGRYLPRGVTFLSWSYLGQVGSLGGGVTGALD